MKFSQCNRVGSASGLAADLDRRLQCVHHREHDRQQRAERCDADQREAERPAPAIPDHVDCASSRGLEPEIDGGGAQAEQAHDAGGRRGLPDVAFEEGVAIGKRRQHLAAIGRAAAGDDEDELEHLERPDHGQDQHQRQGRANARHQHVAEQREEAGAVEPRRLDLVDADLPHRRQEHHREKAPPVPDVDGGDRIERAIGVGEGIGDRKAALVQPGDDAGRRAEDHALKDAAGDRDRDECAAGR